MSGDPVLRAQVRRDLDESFRRNALMSTRHIRGALADLALAARLDGGDERVILERARAGLLRAVDEALVEELARWRPRAGDAAEQREVAQ